MRFQFHKGTIRTLMEYTKTRCLLWFQFHKGTIRTDADGVWTWYNDNFNSIKVRLERPKAIPIVDDDVEFQFHKGTIRTPPSSPTNSQPLNFNSIKVRLELAVNGIRVGEYVYFNSIKVRLERRCRRCRDESQRYFNSIKVRLEPFIIYVYSIFTLISIP